MKQINVQEVDSKSDSNFPDEIQVKVSLRESKIELEKKQAGRFILTTNVLDKMELTTEEMLSKYKEQQSVERGFRFLKDPLFLTDSIFLKSPDRIEALELIMGLCLLVYALYQFEKRMLRIVRGIKRQMQDMSFDKKNDL
ncbi:IS1634 family transposase [Okeania sp. KiyG1]|uniref:IS1634 family transposase n=1 Tax=Okeania sp. KiyG1 TaxID=2720165 RepID=UPI001997DE42|nr:hypothetical protein CYANOKiyG1_70460 [Okeania sp. KiyG1]